MSQPTQPHDRDTPNEQTIPLGPTEKFIGSQFTRVDNHHGIFIYYIATSKPTYVRMAWSSNGETVDVGGTSYTNIPVKHFTQYGLTFGVALINPPLRPYYRLEVLNGAEAQGFVFCLIRLLGSPYAGSFVTIDDPLTIAYPAALTRSVIAGALPDGTSFKNVGVTAQGDLATGFTSVPMTNLSFIPGTIIPIGGDIVGAYTNVKDFASLLVTPESDQLVRGYIEWSRDGVNFSHSITTLFIGAGSFNVPVAAQYARIRVTNLAADPVNFSMDVFGQYQAPSNFMFPLAAPIDPSFYGALTRSVITGQKPDLTYTNVGLDLEGNLRTIVANPPDVSDLATQATLVAILAALETVSLSPETIAALVPVWQSFFTTLATVTQVKVGPGVVHGIRGPGTIILYDSVSGTTGQFFSVDMSVVKTIDLDIAFTNGLRVRGGGGTGTTVIYK